MRISWQLVAVPHFAISFNLPVRAHPCRKFQNRSLIHVYAVTIGRIHLALATLGRFHFFSFSADRCHRSLYGPQDSVRPILWGRTTLNAICIARRIAERQPCVFLYRVVRFVKANAHLRSLGFEIDGSRIVPPKVARFPIFAYSPLADDVDSCLYFAQVLRRC
jgi:hypothetical protein